MAWTEFYQRDRMNEANRQEDRNRVIAAIERENEERARRAEDRAAEFSYGAAIQRQNRDLDLAKYGQDLALDRFDKATERARADRAELEGMYRFDTAQGTERKRIEAYKDRYEPAMTPGEELEAILNVLDAETANVEVAQGNEALRLHEEELKRQSKPITPLPADQAAAARKISRETAMNILRRALPTIGKMPPGLRFDETTGRWTIRPPGPMAQAKTAGPKGPATATQKYSVGQRQWLPPATSTGGTGALRPEPPPAESFLPPELRPAGPLTEELRRGMSGGGYYWDERLAQWVKPGEAAPAGLDLDRFEVPGLDLDRFEVR